MSEQEKKEEKGNETNGGDRKRGDSRDRDRSRDRKKKKKSSRSRRSRSRSRSASGDRDKKKKRKRSRSKSPRDRKVKEERRSSRGREKSKEKLPEDVHDPEAELKRAREAAEREANRDEYTVFVHQIHPRVDERDLFEFFSHVGRVEDIRLIRDQRTHKSKGLAYVEFWEKDSITKACALNGQLIGGYPITIQPTQTDKTRPAEGGGSLKLFVSNLHPKFTEEDLRPVFDAFGPIDFVELHRDSHGASKGYGYVQFSKEADGKQAAQALNGLEIAGNLVKISIVEQRVEHIGRMDLDEDGGGTQLTAQTRQELMAKLARGDSSIGTHLGPMRMAMAPAPTPAPQYNTGVGVMTASHLSVPMIQPTTCVVVKNMFDPSTENDSEFDREIREDVSDECEKWGKLKHIYVDRNSAGYVYMRFSDVAGATKARESLHGRWFATRQISAEFVIEATYLSKFPDAR